MMSIKDRCFKLRSSIKTILKSVWFFKNHCKEIMQYEMYTIVIWGVPEYGNLGDQAITYAEIDFIKGLMPHKKIVTIPEKKCFEYIYPMKLLAKKKQLTFVSQGGGNMGTLYIYQESRRLMLIKHIRDCKIVVFPQSTDYEYGSKAHKTVHRIYARNPGLSLFARDKVNYDKMKNLFPDCRVCLAPDIVSSLDKSQEGKLLCRHGILCCLRSDRESNDISKKALKEIIDYIGNDKCEYLDTYGKQYVRDLEGQEEQLEDFWIHIRKAKLVITDRLHGMIFAMINNTPCMALDNSTGKVLAFYNSWLTDSEGIMVYNNNMNEIKKFIDDCLNNKDKVQMHVFVSLIDHFGELKKELVKR